MKSNVEEELKALRTPEDAAKCVDLNYMVFNYGKFHNNFVN